MAKTRQQVLTEFRQAEILKAASTVFSAHGFDGATVEQIASTAGVAKGTVYLYFGSKDEIYLEAFARNIEDLKGQTLRALAAAPDAAAAVRAFITTKLEYFERNRSFFTVYLSEVGLTRGRSRLNHLLEASYLEQTEQLVEILESAIADGAVRQLRPRAAAFAIFDLTRSTIIQRMRGRSSADVAADAAFVFDLVWKGIGTA